MFANPVVRIVNNWLHDVGTGLWAACLLVIVVLDRRMNEIVPSESSSQVIPLVTETGWLVFWLMVAGLVVIAVTGALRLLYWRAETPADELAAKRPALIGKHIAFTVVYGPGTWYAWWLLADAIA